MRELIRRGSAPTTSRPAVHRLQRPASPWAALQRAVGNYELQRRLQAELVNAQSANPIEREAEDMAERVMSQPASFPSEGEAAVPCSACATSAPCSTCAKPMTGAQGGAGQALPPTTRAFFEPRFGVDLGAVRVHDNSGAGALAQRLRARAFTFGADVFFNAGEYAPATGRGLRLLAHELSHVVQEARSPAPMSIHRAPLDPKARRDVVIVLSKDIGEEVETIAPGAHVVRADTMERLTKALDALEFPIGTLYVSAHATPTGNIVFGYGTEGGSGLQLTPELVTSKLRAVLKSSPERIDFRGCSIGSTPAAVEKYRAALGAQTALATNCFYGVRAGGPILIGKQAIVRRELLDTPEKKTAFAEAFPKLIESMQPFDRCIVDSTMDGYFRGNGHLYAVVLLPDANKQNEFSCFASVRPEDVDPNTKYLHHGKEPASCKRIVVRAPSKKVPMDE